MRDLFGRADVDGSNGRLLAFYPQVTIFDGFAAIESDGFFDANNVPPWDTWIYFVDDYLISYVPQGFMDVVERGLMTNVEECIVWLRDVEHPFVRKLEQHDLLH